MATVKCEFCGAFILDTQDKCPNCGATNTALVRTAKKTPRTIAELKSWYQARNLPPEEVTRFFIGKDIREPRAFGIYQSGNTFIVYKNKADGTRAVRYQGTDEAYAVNELYLRLKEEILNQKNMNITRRAQQSSYQVPTRSQRRSSSRITLNVFLVISAIIIGLFQLISHGNRTRSPYSYQYYLSQDSNKIYYYEGYTYSLDGLTYDWWQYDISQGEWSLAHAYVDEQYPSDIKDKSGKFLDDMAKKAHIDPQVLDIRRSRTYIDSGHHRMPDSSSYYIYNNEPYFFLRDTYGGSTHKPQVDAQYEYMFPDSEESYLTENQSGWYKYSDNGWEFYADSEDKGKLGDDLYYDPDSYRAGSSFYDFSEQAGDRWNVTDFSQTEWYLSAEEAEDIYNNTYDIEHKYNSIYTQQDDDYNDYDYDWDDDYDYDWDTDYDWDYGGTDWDTDW